MKFLLGFAIYMACCLSAVYPSPDSDMDIDSHVDAKDEVDFACIKKINDGLSSVIVPPEVTKLEQFYRNLHGLDSKVSSLELFNGEWTKRGAIIAMPFTDAQELEDNKDVCSNFVGDVEEQKTETQDVSCNGDEYSLVELMELFDYKKEDFEELRSRYPKLVELLALIQGCSLLFRE